MTAVAEEDIPVCAPPDPAPRAPEFGFPPLACDCHAHICGPQAIYKYIPERIYSPPDALLADYQRLLQTLRCERAVLVQPSFYGTDNSAMLAAMRAAGPAFRGVAVIGDDATGRDLEEMHAAGVRGARLNIVDLRDGKGQLPVERINRLAERIRPFGWHIEFLMHVDTFPELDRMLANLPVDVVFGHLGYVRTEKGTAAPGFQALLRLLRGGRAWVKFTGPYRISSQTLPHADTDEFAHMLLATAPDRIVWGTDWPHVMTRWTIPIPTTGRWPTCCSIGSPIRPCETARSTTIRRRSTDGNSPGAGLEGEQRVAADDPRLAAVTPCRIRDARSPETLSIPL